MPSIPSPASSAILLISKYCPPFLSATSANMQLAHIFLAILDKKIYYTLLYTTEFVTCARIPRGDHMNSPAQPTTGKSPETNNNPESNKITPPRKKNCNNCGFCTSLWSKTYHGLGFLGIGIFLGLLLLFLTNCFIPNILCFRPTTLENPNQLDMVIRSYQATITSYNNALFAFIGLFGLLSIGTFVINRSAADKIDREYKNIREKYLQADKEYKRALKVTERHKKELAEHLTQIHEQASEAIKAIENIKEQTIIERRISQQLAEVYTEFLNRNFAKSIQICDTVIKSNPNSPDAYNLKGLILDGTGKYQNAIECYDKAIKIAPEFAPAYYNKGNAYAKLNDYKNAIACYDKAIKIDPEFALAYINKGNAYDILKDYKNAIACYDKAIKIDPELADAYYNKGKVLAILKDYKNAIACYDKAIKIDPEFVLAYINKGNAYDILNDCPNAIACYDKAIKIDPEFAPAYYNKGNAYDILKDYKNAIACYDKAIKIDPEFALAYYNKGKVLNHLNKFTEAIECFNTATKYSQNYPQNYSLAYTYALWHTSPAEPESKPADCLTHCRRHLELALESGELEELGIDHLKTDSDLQNIQQEDWFNQIMRQAFGTIWDNYPSPDDKDLG